MGPHWFLRAVMWARNPPSWKRVKFVVAIVVVCITVAAIDRTWGFPEWMSVDKMRP